MAYMNSPLCFEWSKCIDNEISKQKDRKILLLMKNCSAHRSKKTLPNSQHVEMQFRPPNTTDKLQPLDDGTTAGEKLGLYLCLIAMGHVHPACRRQGYCGTEKIQIDRCPDYILSRHSGWTNDQGWWDWFYTAVLRRRHGRQHCLCWCRIEGCKSCSRSIWKNVGPLGKQLSLALVKRVCVPHGLDDPHLLAWRSLQIDICDARRKTFSWTRIDQFFCNQQWKKFLRVYKIKELVPYFEGWL